MLHIGFPMIHLTCMNQAFMLHLKTIITLVRTATTGSRLTTVIQVNNTNKCIKDTLTVGIILMPLFYPCMSCMSCKPHS